MKMGILMSAFMVFASVTQAEVKAPGTFVPSMCSEETTGNGFSADIIAVQKVCLGTIAGFPGSSALAVYTNDGGAEVFNIEVKEHILRMGPNTAPFRGVSASREGSLVKGEIITIMGIRKSVSIKLVTNGNLKFSGNLEIAFVTL